MNIIELDRDECYWVNGGELGAAAIALLIAVPVVVSVVLAMGMAPGTRRRYCATFFSIMSLVPLVLYGLRTALDHN